MMVENNVPPFTEPFDPAAALADGHLHEAYTWLQTHAPVYWPADGSVIFSRYRDVATIQESNELLRGENSYIRALYGDNSLGETMQSIFQTTGAEHARLRFPVQASFTKAAVEQMRPLIRQVCEQTLDAFEQTGDDIFDVQKHYAEIVPTAVMCQALGIPARDHAVVREYTRRFWPALDLLFLPHLSPVDSTALKERGIDGAAFLSGYVQAVLSLTRERTAGQRPAHVISHLVDSALSDREARALCCDLLMAGHETATTGFGSLMYLSTQYPEYFVGTSLSEESIWESLRLFSPTQTVFRLAGSRLTIGECVLEPGTRIVGLIGAANRDARVFADPHRFDPSRPNVRQALVFGRARTFCLGTALILVEFQEMYAALRHRLPHIELVSSETAHAFHLSWQMTAVSYGPRSVPLRWSTGSVATGKMEA